MISILLLVFLLQLTIHLINKFGKQTINDLLWLLYTKLPTPHSKEATDISQLRRDVVRLQREMNATSTQDEFAKWAKLRRQHDKAKEKYETQAQSQQSFKSTFDRTVSALRWLGTQGLQFFCNFYFSKRAMFWLPRGWVPHAAEWILSCPSAPLGSISVNVWNMACASVIGMVSEAIMGVAVLNAGDAKSKPRKGGKLGTDDAANPEGLAKEQKKEL